MPRWSGTPESRAKAALQSRSIVDGECLRFTGAHDKGGYGRINFRGVNRLAHVLAWELENGPVAPGIELDHVYRTGCRHRDCILLTHLQEVTRAENVQRSRPYHKVGLCAKGLHKQDQSGTCPVCRSDRLREYGRRWRKDNPEKCRKYSREYMQRKRSSTT